MSRIFAGLFAGFIVVLAEAFVPANAASLPLPAKLCPLIGEKNGGDQAWQKTAASDKHWMCGGTTHLFATLDQVRQGDGDVWMIDYSVEGLTKARATQFYLDLHIYSATLWNDRIKTAVLDRLAAVFAASNAGPVPNDVVQAIAQVKSTTVSTALGSVQTRFTPGSGAQYPNIGSTFEVMLIERSS
ncbi:MAG TPA: hypothetical protein VNF99_09535 [Stellaceae bacterium]|nr:hypothetical protein [Stellaceae bacterium]